MFAYCRNNPISRIDVSGTIDVEIMGDDPDTPIDDVGGPTYSSGGGSTGQMSGGGGGYGICYTSGGGNSNVNSYNPIDAGYTYVVDLSFVSNSNVFTPALYSYGYDAYGAYIDPVASGMSACFVQGTPIVGENGMVPIEEVSVGDLVWGWNEETGIVELKKVVRIFTNYTYTLVHIIVDGEEIVTTTEHPFYVESREWITAGKLSKNDILRTLDGNTFSELTVFVEYSQTPITVYNFEVEDFHTYYVGHNALLVHNTCGKTFTPNQDAIIQLGKYYRRHDISFSDAETLWDLVKDVGFDKYTKSFHPAQYDSYQSGKVLHMKINGMHINVIK